jgi:hypothetical protein
MKPVPDKFSAGGSHGKFTAEEKKEVSHEDIQTPQITDALLGNTHTCTYARTHTHTG